jgi:hypothetical protein
MLCGLPVTDNVAVLKVATPEPFSVPVPRVAAPSLKVTVPVGVLVAGNTAATVAVNVTDCPNTLGVPDVATVVVVLALLTVCVSTAEVLVLKLVSLP